RRGRRSAAIQHVEIGIVERECARLLDGGLREHRRCGEGGKGCGGSEGLDRGHDAISVTLEATATSCLKFVWRVGDDHRLRVGGRYGGCSCEHTVSGRHHCAPRMNGFQLIRKSCAEALADLENWRCSRDVVKSRRYVSERPGASRRKTFANDNA